MATPSVLSTAAVAVGSVIVPITLESTQTTAQSNLPVSFGQLFSKGHLPASGAGVSLKPASGAIIPCQLDVKATHTDGSVKHAIVSAIIPALAGSSSAQYDIIRASANTGSAATPSNFAGLNAVATITDTGVDVSGPSAGVVYTADAAAKLANGQYETWLSGPVVTEWLVRVPLVNGQGVEHPDLHARFNIRAYKGQSNARVTCIIENAWVKPLATPTASTPWETVGVSPVVYTYNIKVGGTVVDTRAVSGYHRVEMNYAGNGNGTYDGQGTGIPNNSTLYTAKVSIDGVVKNISLAGSAIQYYGDLFSAVTAQLGGLGFCRTGEDYGSLEIVSNSTGPNSSVKVTDYGTLFPALSSSDLNRSTTTPVTYTAAISVGGVSKDISVVGKDAHTLAQLCAALDVQLGGLATTKPTMTGFGVEITPTTTGAAVVVTEGTLFATTKQNLLSPFRNIRGDEYIHRAGTRWKKNFWWGSQPQVHIRHDKSYMIDSLGVVNLPKNLAADAPAIDTMYNAIKANEDIGRNGVCKATMSGTGYAANIGLHPEWVSLFILDQGVKSKYTMLKQADLQGSFNVHHRDYRSDKPVSFANWPYVTRSPTANDSKNPVTKINEKLPDYVRPSSIHGTLIIPDTAHHPDFCYVPYLVTGDHDYLEGLLFYFSYVNLLINPAGTLRDGAKCIWYSNQVRGIAWSLRTTVHARNIVPDNHPAATDLDYILTENAKWFIANYADPAGPKHNIFGHSIKGLIYTSGSGDAPWQEDFVIAAVGRALELGREEWRPYFDFVSKNIAGRLTSGPDFCWQGATAYNLNYRLNSSSPLYTSWREVYMATFPASVTSAQCGSVEMATALGVFDKATIPQNSMMGRASWAAGRPANMQPAVAFCAGLDAPKGKDAWLVFSSKSEAIDYSYAPQFGIEPRVYASAVEPESPPPTIDPPTINNLMSLADRVKDSTTTTGTGAFALAGAPDVNFRPFLTAPVQVGDTVPYAAVHRTMNEWENGEGVLTAALTLARTRVTSSSNNNLAVNFSAGVKDVSLTLTADYLSKLAGTNSVVTTDLTGAVKLIINQDGSPKQINLTDAGITFGQLGVLSAPAVGTDEVPIVRNGIEYRTPLTVIAAAIAAINGTPPAADTTAPTLSAASGTQTGTTTATGAVTTNEANGTIYCLVSTSSTATVADVKASTVTQAVTATGSKTFAITGLTASTAYYLHFLHRDAAGNDSTVLSSVSFTTAAVADTTAPILSSPVGTQTGATTATATVGTNEANGTMYCLISTVAAPTAAQVKASTLAQAVTTTGTKTFNATGLTASTTYYAHFLHRDASGNDSAIASSATFVTPVAADTTAPTLSSPTGTQTGTTTASGSVSTNEANGTLYRMVSINATETVATIKAAALTTTVTATGVQNVTFTGLTSGTQYYAHYVHTDAAGNDSTVANSVAFTTTAAAPLTVATPTAQQAGVNFTLSGTYSGTAPTALDYSSDGGTTWYQPITAATIDTTALTWSMSVWTQSQSASQTMKVRKRNVLTDTATTGTYSVSAAKVYTITGYDAADGMGPNKVEATYDATALTTTGGGMKQIPAADLVTGAYWHVKSGGVDAPGVKAGWASSATIPPNEITSTQNLAAAALNGLALAAKTGANVFPGGAAWVYVPATPGTYSMSLWLRPTDSIAVNLGTVVVTVQ